MSMIIYKITNRINGKVYIGQTIHTLEQRWKQHLKNARNGVKTHLYSAIRKYGEENFEPEIICSADTKEELNLLETYYIQEYNSIDVGYNMVDGGNNNVMFIPYVKQHHKEVVCSEEIRHKVSEGMKRKIAKGEFFTPEHRKHLSEAMKGNHNFGTGDTRSIPCYCIVNDNVTYHFKNYKEAGIWWYKAYHPFGEKYSQATYQRKIIDCIDKGYCEFKKKRYDFDYIKWYREGGDA